MSHLKRKLLVGYCAIAVSVGGTSIIGNQTHALTVFDPTNYSQNLLTAARNLQQINNQVRQLANEAQLLINQAQNLTSLPTSVASELQTSLQEVDALVQSAQGLAYEVSAIDREYRRLFPEEYSAGISTSQIVRDARATWSLARNGFKHSLEVQAEVVNRLRADASTLDRLIVDSQGAVGNLQALQAGNQLTALATKQSMQLQTLLAASARADALQRADAAAARERGRARFKRFLGDRNAYTR